MRDIRYFKMYLLRTNSHSIAVSKLHIVVCLNPGLPMSNKSVPKRFFRTDFSRIGFKVKEINKLYDASLYLLYRIRKQVTISTIWIPIPNHATPILIIGKHGSISIDQNSPKPLLESKGFAKNLYVMSITS